MIRIGTLDTTEAPAQPWRAGAAYDADRAATSSEQFVTMLRHDTVRSSLTILTAPARTPFDTREPVLAHVVRLLADSVERQAFHSGLGRVTIPVPGVLA